MVALNLGGFAAEFAVAVHAGSVSLFADSVDFLEDASIGLLVAVALGWPVRRRAAMGMALAGVLLVPAAATLWTAGARLAAMATGSRVAWLAPPWLAGTVPASGVVMLAGAGGLAVNLVCATLLARHRAQGGSLGRAAFLSARNDVAGNLAVIGAGALTAAWPSAWPDLAAGLGIAALNAGAAREVWQAARAERRSQEGWGSAPNPAKGKPLEPYT